MSMQLSKKEPRAWTEDWYERFMQVIRELPEETTLCLSGGVESSSILYAMSRLERLPTECLTFQVANQESDDLKFTRLLCEFYDVPLRVARIPVLSKEGLLEEVSNVIKIINFSRNIDVQCCHAFSYMLKKATTKNIVTGFYEDCHYESNKKVSMLYRRMKKGEVDKTYFDEYYRYGRECIYRGFTRQGTVHNYVVIEKFLRALGYELYCPFHDKELFKITQALDFEGTNFYNGKFKKKWFLTHLMFVREFSHFKNHKNSNNMHTQGLKQYHRDTLLAKTEFKDTVAIYNRVKDKSLGNKITVRGLLK